MKKYSPKKLSLIKKSLAATLAILSTSAFALSPLPFPVWTVEGGKLLDPNGNPFIFRGVTIDHTLAPEKTIQALKDAAALGANSAQIEFPIKSSGSSFPRPIANQLRDIVTACKDNKLVCVLEANDAAGYYEVEGGLSPDVVAEFWGYPDIRDALQGSQGHIVLAISNQPLAPIFGFENYIGRMQSALSELRRRYPLFLLMVDGSNWGQDTDKAMHTLAARNLQSTNTEKNVIYSVEMFDQYVNPETVRDYIATFSEIGAPLVIGGFGPVPYYHPHFNGSLPFNEPRLPAEAVMQYAEQYGAGYFGWSWSGNKNSALDVVIDWNPGHLTSWGNILFNDANGIKATAKPASIFNNSSSSLSSSSVSSNRNPIALIDNTAFEFVRCGEVYGKASALRSYDPDGDALAYNWAVSGYGSTYAATGPEIRFPAFWPNVDYIVSLGVSDGKGGISYSNVALRHSYSNVCPPPQSSSSMSSSSRSSSSIPRSSVSSIPISSSTSSRSSSSAPAKALCSYVINSQWNNGFTAAVRIKNTTSQTISGWSVNWQYSDGSKITGSWNASLTGANPYNAKNLSWNTSIQPGQTVEFGFQGSKPAGAAITPIVGGPVCQ